MTTSATAQAGGSPAGTGLAAVSAGGQGRLWRSGPSGCSMAPAPRWLPIRWCSSAVRSPAPVPAAGSRIARPWSTWPVRPCPGWWATTSIWPSAPAPTGRQPGPYRARVRRLHSGRWRRSGRWPGGVAPHPGGFMPAAPPCWGGNL